jgi:hypothetical protein
MLALTCGKRTTDFSQAQLKVWHASLCSFPAHVINRGVVEMILDGVRFPEVGDLYDLCRKQIPKKLTEAAYTAHGKGNAQRVGKNEIEAVAERLGLSLE